jgi:hypothetical protein
MEEARSSWNTLYQSADGFECQITLRDEDEAILFERADAAMADIARTGGVALQRRGYAPNHRGSSAPAKGNGPNGSSRGGSNGGNGNGAAGNGARRAKTYLDDEGERRCNQILVNGEVCGAPVTRREGRYGPFWGCPQYREHANRRD